MRIRIGRNMFLPGGVPVQVGQVIEASPDVSVWLLTYGWGVAVRDDTPVAVADATTATDRQTAARKGSKFSIDADWEPNAGGTDPQRQ